MLSKVSFVIVAMAICIAPEALMAQCNGRGGGGMRGGGGGAMMRGAGGDGMAALQNLMEMAAAQQRMVRAQQQAAIQRQQAAMRQFQAQQTRMRQVAAMRRQAAQARLNQKRQRERQNATTASTDEQANQTLASLSNNRSRGGFTSTRLRTSPAQVRSTVARTPTDPRSTRPSSPEAEAHKDAWLIAQERARHRRRNGSPY